MTMLVAKDLAGRRPNERFAAFFAKKNDFFHLEFTKKIPGSGGRSPRKEERWGQIQGLDITFFSFLNTFGMCNIQLHSQKEKTYFF